MEDHLSNLLRMVVEEYVATAEPVGSQRLVDAYGLDVSPATVRNWFAELDDAGYLVQPHTSGGRIPTEKGFRWYIDANVRPKPAGKREREMLSRAAALPSGDGRRVKGVAKALAELLNQATFVGTNDADAFYTGLSQLFAQPEFQSAERVLSLSEILDNLDDTLTQLRRQPVAMPRILIGRDCPFGPSCGIVIGFAGGDLIGMLGPTRMDYQHAMSLMQTALDILNDSYYG